jgi:outer membrane protein TolC
LAYIEIIRAEADVANKEEEIISVKNEILNLQDNLINELNIMSGTENSITINLTDTPLIFSNTPDLKKSIDYSFKHIPEYLKIKQQIINSNLKLKYYKNQKLPQVDLTGTLQLNGLSGDFNNTYDQVTNSDYPNWQINLSFNIPLGNKKNKSSYNIEKINKTQTLNNLKTSENNIITNVKTSIRSIKSSIEKIEAAKKSLKLAKENLRLEKMRFELQKSTTRDLLEIQEDFDEAKTKMLQAVVEHKKTYSSFETITGLILKKYNLNFK